MARLERIRDLRDPQREWLLLSQCHNAWPIHMMRSTPPEATRQSMAAHDEATLQAFFSLLPHHEANLWDCPLRSLQVRLAPSLGGTGLSAREDQVDAAYVSCLKKVVPRIRKRLESEAPILLSAFPELPKLPFGAAERGAAAAEMDADKTEAAGPVQFKELAW